MDREEAYILFGVDIDRWNSDVEKSILHCIDKIYNDFESRTCVNCKHIEYGNFDNSTYCGIDCSSNQYKREKTVTKDFGCNLFEMKAD